MTQFNQEDFADSMDKFLRANVYRTTLFGKSVDLSNEKSIAPCAEWFARVVFDCIAWKKEQNVKAPRGKSRKKSQSAKRV